MPEADHNGVPHNARFERCVLGTALWSTTGLQTVVQRTKRSDYYITAHQELYDYLTGVVDEPHVPISRVAHALRNSRAVEHAGGAEFLDALLDEAVPIPGLDAYVSDLQSQKIARNLIATGDQLTASGHSSHGDPDSIKTALSQAQDQLWALTDTVSPTDYDVIGDVVTEAYEKACDPNTTEERFSTGFVDLDRKLNGGFLAGQLIVVGGRPSAGKSMLGLDFLRAACIKKNVPGLLVSLEMTSHQHGLRVLSAESGVPIQHLMEGRVSERDHDRIHRHLPNILEAPFYIADMESATMPDVEAQVRLLKRRYGLRYMAVDYQQLLEGSRPGMSRFDIVSENSRRLKALAKREEIPVVMMAQLRRSDKRPQMDDLKESGQIEQDADVVLLIHREEQSSPDTDRPGQADIDVAKNRSGQTGTVALTFMGHEARFASLAH